MATSRLLRHGLTVFALSLLTWAAWAGANDLTGTWKGVITTPMGAHDIVLLLDAKDGSLSGSLKGAMPDGKPYPISDAHLEGDQLTFKLVVPGPGGKTVAFGFKGTVAGNRIAGIHEVPGRSVPWEVTRE